MTTAKQDRLLSIKQIQERVPNKSRICLALGERRKISETR